MGGMLMDYMREIKEISAEQAIILWQASRLSLSKIYEKAPEILKVQGSVIGTLGNFSASIGKAKSKKTFNVSAIVAASLKNGTVLRYVAELPENKRKVLYVDTEQSHYHCLKVMKRILRLAGLPDAASFPASSCCLFRVSCVMSSSPRSSSAFTVCPSSMLSDTISPVPFAETITSVVSNTPDASYSASLPPQAVSIVAANAGISIIAFFIFVVVLSSVLCFSLSRRGLKAFILIVLCVFQVIALLQHQYGVGGEVYARLVLAG